MSRCLSRADGRRWQSTDFGDYANMFERVVARLGSNVSFYSLRHTQIIRAILPASPSASSPRQPTLQRTMIERTY